MPNRILPETPLEQAPLAYQNDEFLDSPDARILRIIAEYQEPMARFRRERIQDTVVRMLRALRGVASVEDRDLFPYKSLCGTMLSAAHGDAKRAPPDLVHRVLFHISPNIVKHKTGGGHAIPFHVGIDREEKHEDCDTTKQRTDEGHIWRHSNTACLDYVTEIGEEECLCLERPPLSLPLS